LKRKRKPLATATVKLFFTSLPIIVDSRLALALESECANTIARERDALSPKGDEPQMSMTITGAAVEFANVNDLVFVWVDGQLLGGFPDEQWAMGAVVYRLQQIQKVRQWCN
jgi:hypothetical protein